MTKKKKDKFEKVKWKELKVVIRLSLGDKGQYWVRIESVERLDSERKKDN